MELHTLNALTPGPVSEHSKAQAGLLSTDDMLAEHDELRLNNKTLEVTMSVGMDCGSK